MPIMNARSNHTLSEFSVKDFYQGNACFLDMTNTRLNLGMVYGVWCCVL